ncbi:HAD family hydrolase [Pseudonocardia hispaniensis]|uniref:HAD family hydrolase n=1 Tax=Pseudonocardia hispaniensis TaxID=904933 RepID=A0ABW1IZ18_9PSEU
MNPLARLLADHPHVLLDFDGPICGAFEGVTDRWLAEQLRATLAAAGFDLLPADIKAISDPFAVLRYSPQLGSDVPAGLDTVFVELEQQAVRVAPPTPGAADAIAALRAAGHTVTVVSNNSEPAIRAYLRAHELDQFVTGVIGREIGRPALLKPHPHAVLRAARELDTIPARCVLVGDSLSDLEAAHTAGTVAIGHANKPGKRETFTALEPAAIIELMTELVDAVVARRR